MTPSRTVIGNWKMNTSLTEARALAERVATSSPRSVSVGVTPPFPWLPSVRDILQGSPVSLGAQTCSANANGAHTGEVSVAMLTELCSFVLVGHSERRAMSGETDAVVRAKLEAVLAAGLDAVLCVGETLDQREAGEQDEVVIRQLRAALDGLPSASAKVTIAYEPVWAIGTGRTATPEDAAAVARTIRKVCDDLTLRSVQILYGGSVTAANAESLLADPEVGGFLVGGASLMAVDFLTIIAAADV